MFISQICASGLFIAGVAACGAEVEGHSLANESGAAYAQDSMCSSMVREYNQSACFVAALERSGLGMQTFCQNTAELNGRPWWEIELSPDKLGFSELAKSCEQFNVNTEITIQCNRRTGLVFTSWQNDESDYHSFQYVNDGGWRFVTSWFEEGSSVQECSFVNNPDRCGFVFEKGAAQCVSTASYDYCVHVQGNTPSECSGLSN